MGPVKLFYFKVQRSKIPTCKGGITYMESSLRISIEAIESATTALGGYSEEHLGCPSLLRHVIITIYRACTVEGQRSQRCLKAASSFRMEIISDNAKSKVYLRSAVGPHGSHSPSENEPPGKLNSLLLATYRQAN